MISDPDFFLDELAAAGSTSFLVHGEGNNNLHRTVFDQVLVMTVNPGFGHQHFLQSTLPKIRRIAQMIERIQPECE